MTKITVYTKPSCPQCVATKRHLDRLGLPYEEDDATEPGNLAALKALGFMAAPVVVADPDAWAGYRPELITALAERINAEEAHA